MADSTSMPPDLVERAAVLVLDCQQDIIGSYVGEQTQFLYRAQDVIDAARKSGIPVLFVGVAFREGHPEVNPRNKAFAAAKQADGMREGTEGVQMHPIVAPEQGDVVILKRRISAFGTTDLHTVLRALGRDVLVLMGVATSGAVLYTFCSALDADYELVVVEDGCFEADDEFHRVLMEKVFSRHGAVIQAKDFVKTLSH